MYRLSFPDMRTLKFRLSAPVFGAAALLLVASASTRAQAPSAAVRPTGATTFDSTQFGGLHWRSIGPYRGGRVTTVVGVAQEPLTYYMGSTGGGIWKTDDAGATWRNISDTQIRHGSIGSLAVAPSDPNVVYAGMGEREPRGQSSTWGDGVYRSTDAGKTWTYTGLEATKSIA
ncbi:MAG TPA: glycosyl hydrolase, partial [Gemmatimonadaceae bacterium]|nr:glycosyl hydrolase [Gemmatimonadaceae bacterium]